MCSLIETCAGADLPALWYCVGWVGMQPVLLTYCYNIYTDNFSLWHWENDFLFSVQPFGLGHLCTLGEGKLQECWHEPFWKFPMFLTGKQSLGKRQQYHWGWCILNHFTLSFVHLLARTALSKAFFSSAGASCWVLVLASRETFSSCLGIALELSKGVGQTEQPVLQVEVGLRCQGSGRLRWTLLFWFGFLQGFQRAWPIHFSYSCHLLGSAAASPFWASKTQGERDVFRERPC